MEKSVLLAGIFLRHYENGMPYTGVKQNITELPSELSNSELLILTNWYKMPPLYRKQHV